MILIRNQINATLFSDSLMVISSFCRCMFYSQKYRYKPIALNWKIPNNYLLPNLTYGWFCRSTPYTFFCGILSFFAIVLLIELLKYFLVVVISLNNWLILILFTFRFLATIFSNHIVTSIIKLKLIQYWSITGINMAWTWLMQSDIQISNTKT